MTAAHLGLDVIVIEKERQLGDGPFYAVRIVPGSLGTFAGLKTDDLARVLDVHNQPISGLYAVGNDMSSIMGGNYPAGGITLGPGMTFGYVAAHHAANVPLDNNRTTELYRVSDCVTEYPTCPIQPSRLLT